VKRRPFRDDEGRSRQENSMSETIRLSPVQQSAFDDLRAALSLGSVFTLWADTGRGRTTVLRELHREFGGVLLTLRDFVAAAQKRHPMALEDALYDLVFEALRQQDYVFVDDLHVATAVMSGGCHFYPRFGYLDAPMTVLASYAGDAGKKLVVGTADGRLPGPLRERGYSFDIDDFKPADYVHLCGAFLGDPARKLDFEKVHRFAPKLNAHQLKGACLWFQGREPVDTDAFIEYLRSQRMASNVELCEVAQVDLRELKGVDDVIQCLEANIVLPLENDLLATELDLKAKRGVLLVGPPGTGKTTVGRALAHRLKGKFFLIDGTFISGTEHFYGMIHHVFESAKENAPSVIFIDDSDVIFESGEEHGLYRYLLTMLDGLESKSAARVCVMMTAMDVGNLPPALIRSGRVELWLEMRVPDASARRTILEQLVAALPESLRDVDFDALASATDGFTGADLRRMMDDSKALYAYDRSTGSSVRPISDYFGAAIEGVRRNKQRYDEAESRARALRPVRPAWFNPSLQLARSRRRRTRR
jgi:transitional endoplasmic reticulum ATPase